MSNLATAWDIRALFWILGPISRLYLLFAIFAAIWMVLTISQTLILTRPWRKSSIQQAERAQLRLASRRRNLREFFSLNIILFAGCFLYQLLLGIRSLEFMLQNPNIDAVAPFDGLIFLTTLGFALLALIHGTRWYVLAKIHEG